MQIQEDKHGDICIFTISEHLDTAASLTFENRLLGAIDRGENRLLVDCTPLDYVNSAGLKVFLLAAKKLETSKGHLVLCGLTPSVKMIFDMIGFTRIMHIVETRQDGLSALSEPA